MVGSGNRDYITSVKCIGSAYKTILLLLLNSKVNILYIWCKYNDLDNKFVIILTETDYGSNATLLK